MKKLFNFGLKSGTVGVATEQDIQELCVVIGTTVYAQDLSSHSDVENFICEGGIIDEGFYQVSDGTIEVTGEEEDYEIVLIPFLRLVV
jgi:hypothetical protein